MIDHDLHALSERLEWPRTPDIASAVQRRLEATPAPSETGATAVRARRGRHGATPWPRRRRLAAALAALALVPAGAAFGDDVLEWLGLKSVAVERVPRLPDDARRPVVDELGERVSLEEAERRSGFAPVTPEALGAPQEIRLDGHVVTLVYRRGDVLLAQLPGALDRDLVTKSAGPGTDVRQVENGILFTGASHAYLYRRPGGDVGEDRPRLAGDTFVTERGDVLLRLEAPGLTVERARALLR